MFLNLTAEPVLKPNSNTNMETCLFTFLLVFI